ncbi:VENN motif pre-toxin domain-containing protein, partial [Proteus hauseri]|uniref:VENN motif pre-toxin domain-containing protein n=1 Tax=Proteus hauseri TaxID=183417 RepID=UPI0032D9E02E
QGDIAGLKQAQAKHPNLSVSELRETKEYNHAMERFGTGSDLQKAAQAVTGALTALSGNNLAGALASGASPYLATEIKNRTTNTATGEVDIVANTLAHTLLGAVTAELNNQSAVAGGLGAGGGELAARVIASNLFPNKAISELTESEKQKVSALSQLAAGLAGGISTGNIEGAVTAAQTGKNAVENNHLSPEKTRARSEEFAQCNGDNSCRAEVRGIYQKEYDKVQEQINNCSNPDQCIAVAKELKEWQKIYSERANELLEKAHNNGGIEALTVAEQKEFIAIKNTIPNLDGSRNLAIYRAELLGGSEETTKERDLAIAAAGIGAGIGSGKGGNNSTSKESQTGKVNQQQYKSVAPNILIGRQDRTEMSGSQVKRLVNDMKINGFNMSEPIDVAIVNGKMIIIDGHHRVEAARKAGIKDIPVRINVVTKEQGDQLLREAAEARARR